MGFFDDYDVDINEFNENGGFDAPDGNYSFEITKAYVKKGTQKDEEAVNIVVSFSLESEEGEAYTFSEWFPVPTDPDNVTKREKRRMGEFKKLLLLSGVAPENLQEAGPEDLEGGTGTVTLKTRKGNDGNDYQNPSNYVFDGADSTPAPAKPARTTARKPAAAKAAPKAAAKPAAAPAKKVVNPFAPKK